VTFLSDRSERFFDSQAIFSPYAQTFSGSGLEVRFAWGSRGDVRGLLGGRHMSGSGSELVRMVDCEHAAASLASSPSMTPIWSSQYNCSNLNRKLQSQKLAFGE
jgi:hypothetical protein